MPAFQVKLGANDLNCVDVLLNPTQSVSMTMIKYNNTSLFNQLQKHTVSTLQTTFILVPLVI